MGFAYLLAPKSSTLACNAKDKLITDNALENFIRVFFTEYAMQLRCTAEFKAFLTTFSSLGGDAEVEFLSMSSFEYWSVYGRHTYPLLSKIAFRILGVPASSAAYERVWSASVFIHSKKRNKLNISKVEKLDFLHQLVVDGREGPL